MTQQELHVGDLMTEGLGVGDLVRIIQRNGKLGARLYTVECIIPAIDSVFIRPIDGVATFEYRPWQVKKVDGTGVLDLAA